MKEFVLRKSIMDDLKISFEIRRNAMMEYISEAKGWDEEEEWKQHVKDFDTDIMQIIEVESKPVGVFEAVIGDKVISIHGLYILKEFQNYRIGSETISEVIRIARDEKRSVHLQVLKVNIKAKRFYEKLGFNIESENEHYCQMIYKNVE